MTQNTELYVQEYSTNLELLSQQLDARFANKSRIEMGEGKAFRMLSQIDETDAEEETVRAETINNIEVVHDGRWVYPINYGWRTIVDSIDTLRMQIQPNGRYVQDAVAAMNRRNDSAWLTAFFGDAKTGETGATTTSFDSNNVVAVNLGGGGSDTGLNITKMDRAQRILLDNDVDITQETIYMGVTPKLHEDLKALTQVTSGDFNTRRPLGEDGLVRMFNGMVLVVSTLLPTDSNGDVRCPVWVESGMGKAMWQPMQADIRELPNYKRKPDLIEVTEMVGYTRLEEAKCVEIKCDPTA